MRHSITLALALVITLIAAAAAADTSGFADRRDRIGPHDIRRVVVDNTGTTVGASVVHHGSRWKGAVRLAFDTVGGTRPEYVAVVPHGHPGEATYRRADGRPWRCASRTVRSRWVKATTSLRAARSCLGGASRLRVQVRATSPHRSADVKVTGKVLQQSRPNVVMIMVDDMRADDLRYMPWTRRLIGREGVNFRNSFAPYPLCCPARASVLTGQYTHNHRVFHVNKPWGFTSFNDTSTVATWLRRAGYATEYLGKYLNGYGRMPEPGADSGKSLHYVPPGWSMWRASIDGGMGSRPKAGKTYEYYDTTLSRNGLGFTNYAGRYQTHVYGELSEQIIDTRAASDKPFFLYASYTAPHNGGPVEPDDPKFVRRDDGARTWFGTPARPDGVKGMFDSVIAAAPGASWADPDFSDKPDYLRSLPPLNDAERIAVRDKTRQRAEALHEVDLQVRRTIEALKRSGELEETMVLFTSDNGYFLGEQRLRQGKIFPHDASLRVPLLVRGPGIPKNEDRFDPFLSIDYAPTLAQLAGVRPATPVDGVSMLRVARHGDRGWKRAVLTETGPGSVVRDADESGAPLDIDDPGQADIRWAIGIRSDRYLYIDLASGEEELYDMAVDPRQYDNLVDDDSYAAVLEKLRAELHRMRACDADACSAPMTSELRTAPGASILGPAG
jgi:N-acetylglucosamine-6-sulfatase